MRRAQCSHSFPKRECNLRPFPFFESLSEGPLKFFAPNRAPFVGALSDCLPTISGNPGPWFGIPFLSSPSPLGRTSELASPRFPSSFEALSAFLQRGVEVFPSLCQLFSWLLFLHYIHSLFSGYQQNQSLTLQPRPIQAILPGRK